MLWTDSLVIDEISEVNDFKVTVHRYHWLNGLGNTGQANHSPKVEKTKQKWKKEKKHLFVTSSEAGP